MAQTTETPAAPDSAGDHPQTFANCGDRAEFALIGVAGRRLRVGQWHTGRHHACPLLLLGGIGMNIEMFEPVARGLRDRRVIAVDMPGIGGSPDPVFPYTIPQMALTLAALLDRLDIDRVDVLGISWGGALAQQFAFQHRARTRRLVLAATAAGNVMVPGQPGLVAAMLDPLEFTVERTLRRNLAMLYNGGGSGRVSLNAATPPTPLGWACQLSSFAGWNSLPLLPLLTMPVLIMADNDDQLVPVANAHVLAGAIPGAQLRLFDGGGHLFMLSEPHAFTRAVHEFLA